MQQYFSVLDILELLNHHSREFSGSMQTTTSDTQIGAWLCYCHIMVRENCSLGAVLTPSTWPLTKRSPVLHSFFLYHKTECIKIQDIIWVSFQGWCILYSLGWQRTWMGAKQLNIRVSRCTELCAVHDDRGEAVVVRGCFTFRNLPNVECGELQDQSLKNAVIAHHLQGNYMPINHFVH